MTKIPDFLQETDHEEVTREELYKRVYALVGSCQRTSIELKNIAVCRVDKGSTCNTVLGFWVYKDDMPIKFYAVKGLTDLEQYKRID